MKKVLMCKPSYFRVDYSINPWMKIGSVNQPLALTQWNNLVNEYRKLNIEVVVIGQDEKFPDMVFSADQGVLIDDTSILLSRFRYKERRGESEIYLKWYQDNGYTVKKLPENYFFEGNGELQKWRDILLIGTGFRTTPEASKAVGKVLNTEIISLELINEKFYHLDTCLMVLDKDTVFYYPDAFSKKSIGDLQSRIPNLILIDEHDVENFASNSVVVDSTVIMHVGSVKMPSQIEELGYRVVNIDIGEFVKAGGGAHCLTGFLGDK